MENSIRLTPADKGFLFLALDDCKLNGLGDDDTVDHLMNVILDNDITESKTEAQDIAYKFFRKNS